MNSKKYFDCEPVQVQKANLTEYLIDGMTEEEILAILPESSAKKWTDSWETEGARPDEVKVFINEFPFTFDIETTNTIDFFTGNVAGFMYHWAVTYDTLYIRGRKWDSFMKLYSAICTKLYEVNHPKFWIGGKKKFRLCCVVHNFGGFEWQFIRKRLAFNKESFFAKDERCVIYADTMEGVRFLDTMSIFGCGLASTAKQSNTPTRKAVGDLDYSKMRNSQTTLNEKELGYIYNDVAVLHEVWEFLIGTYVKQGKKLPITMTQKLRSDVKADAKKVFSAGKKAKTSEVKWLVSLFPETLQEYEDMYKWLFTGGYTHSNASLSGMILEDVYGIDFTSSYPAVMMQSSNFPMTQFIDEPDGLGRDNKMIEDRSKCYIARIKFKNLTAITEHSIMSVSKAMENGEAEKMAVQKNISKRTAFRKLCGDVVVDNGRVNFAESITFYVTELDFAVIKNYYQWDSYEVITIKSAMKGHLPEYVRDNIIDPYYRKALLKVTDPDHDTNPLYMVAKGTVNGGYGMMVEKPHSEEAELDENGNVKMVHKRGKMTDNEWCRYLQFGDHWASIVEGKKAPCKVLSPYWGVYVTSIARYRLLMGDEDGSMGGGVAVIGADAIYCDTDSIYFMNHEKYMEWVNAWNEHMKEKNAAWVSEYNSTHPNSQIEAELFMDLGGFDPISKDGKCFTRFMTWGAKRYMKECSNGEIIGTVAGCPKKIMVDGKKVNCIPYYAEKAGVSPFDFFTDKMTIEKVKNGHSYCDDRAAALVTDDEGHSEWMVEESSIGITAVDFTMKMTDDYLSFLNMVREDYTYEAKF